MLLLSDGTVMVQAGGGTPSSWYKLTPDASGNYFDGTFTPLTPMNVGRSAYTSDVLPDGRVFVFGGEYSTAGSETNTGEIFDPTANGGMGSWTNITIPPILGLGDAPSEVLGNRTVLVGGGQTKIYDPMADPANPWSNGPTMLNGDNGEEETWVKLPDGSILTYSIQGSQPQRGQRFVPGATPAQDQWVDAGSVPVPLAPNGNNEIGPAFLLPNGKVFFVGATGHTALYTPPPEATPTGSGSWAQGPDMLDSSNNLVGAVDAPGAEMPNGNVLVTASQVEGFNGSPPTNFFEYNWVANTLTPVSPPIGMTSSSLLPNGDRMLVLPTGQVLFSNASSQLYLYNPSSPPVASGQPIISNITFNRDALQAYTLSGTLLNGISEGANFGDDAEMASNYPIVRITDSAGNISYARTFNWSSTGVSSVQTLETTEFTLPDGVARGPALATVIGNGNPSVPFSFNIVSGPLTVATLSDAANHTGISLRDAVLQATSDATQGELDTIHFAPSLGGGTIILSQPLELSGPVTIDGSQLAGGIAISGNQQVQVFQIDSTANVVLNGLALFNGSVQGSGGVINNEGTLTLENSSIEFGIATIAGGIYNGGTLTVINSTVSRNTARGNGNGGGLVNQGTMLVTNSTISGNTAAGAGGGIDDIIGATLNNTIVAGNQAGVAANSDFFGSVLAGNNNLIGIGYSTLGLTNLIFGNQVGTTNNSIKPLLSALDNYGGPTGTMALLPLSPAFDKGSSSVAVDGQGNPLTTDQRGDPRVVNGKVDIGAYQTQTAPFLVTTAADPGGIAGQLSLGEALNLANAVSATGASPTVTFAPALNGSTITSTQGDFGLFPGTGSTITINGGNQIAISQNVPLRIFSIFFVGGIGKAVINGLTIENAQGNGGILNEGNLTVSNCLFTGNVGAIDGGGILNVVGTLTVMNSTFTNNSAQAGGAIYNLSSTLTVSNSTFTNNSAVSGGTIQIDSASTATVTDSTISVNSASGVGAGGIENGNTLVLENSIVSNNTGAMGVFSDIVGGITQDKGYNLLGKALQGHTTPPINSPDHFSNIPGLAPLGNYGGLTPTLALLPNSPAIGVGGPFTTLAAQSSSSSPTIQVVDGTFFAATALPTLSTGSYFTIQFSNEVFEINGMTLNPNGTATLIVKNERDIGGSTTNPSGAGTPVFLVSDQRGLSAVATMQAVVDIGAFNSKPGLTVTTGFDQGISGQLSLREAVNLANAYTTADFSAIITFATPAITLTQGPLNLNGFPATGTATISIEGGANPETITGPSLFVNATRVTVVLENLNIFHGGDPVTGNGGIVNLGGTVTVASCTIRGSLSLGIGSGIDNFSGSMTVTNSTLSANIALVGGGINNVGGNLTVTNSTISGNKPLSGGGIENAKGGTLTIINSTISGNAAVSGNTGLSGGGIENSATLVIQNTIVADNTADTGPDVDNAAGSVTAGDCMIGDPSGNGITPANGNIVSPSAFGFNLISLSNFGGPTQTFALLPTSPAVGAGGAVTTTKAGGNLTIAANATTATLSVTDAAMIAATPGTYAIQVQDSALGTVALMVTAVDFTDVPNTITVQVHHAPFPQIFNANDTITLVTDQRGFSRPPTAPDIGAYQVSDNSQNGVEQLIVDTAADTTGVAGTTSLRDAIAEANANTGNGVSDLITFDTNKMGTNIVTLSQQLILDAGTGTTTIDGGGNITINGNNSRIFEVFPGALAVVTGLTIQHGSAQDGLGGSGISNSGILTVSSSTVSFNTAASNNGGGIDNYSSGYLTISNVTFDHNSSSGNGGGIDNSGVITGTDDTFTGNTANNGGGIYNESGAILNLTSMLAKNSASNSGGGIYNIGRLTLTDSTLSGNTAQNGSGGAISNFFGLTLSNDTLMGNTAGLGGGVFNNSSALVTLTGDTFSNNIATGMISTIFVNNINVGGGGGIFNFSGELTSTGDTFFDNSATNIECGGGIYNNDTFTSTKDTYSGNTANSGGGIFNMGHLTLTNATLTGNSVLRLGGAIFNQLALTLSDDTLAGNNAGTGGGIANFQPGLVTLINSIVAGNTGNFAGFGVVGPDITGSVNGANNIIGDGTDMNGIVDSAVSGDMLGNQVGVTNPNHVNPIDPLLAPLGNYGGPTQTMALLPGSPALGNGGAVTSTVAGNLTIPANATNTTTTATLTVANAAAIASSPGTYNIILEDKQGNQGLFVTAVDFADKPNTLTVDVSPGFFGQTFSANDPIYLLEDQRGQLRSALNSFDIGAYQAQLGTLTGSIVVDTDSATGIYARITLSDAVNLAEAEAPAAPGTTQTITFAGGVNAITLTDPIPITTGTLVIQGQVKISGNFTSKLFIIGQNATISFGSGITFGQAEPFFGAISNAGTLTLNGCTLSGNTATEFGGAIYNTGTLIVSNCTFTGNIAGVSGGAIYNAGGTVMLSNCTFSDNSAALDGGAIFNESSGTLTVADSTLSGNSAGNEGGGIENEGTLKVAYTVMAGNSSQGGGTSPFTIDDSANTSGATYTITATTVQLNGLAPISYAGSQGLLVKGGSGKDIYNVEATTDTAPVTLAAGTGFNTVNVSPTSMDLGNLESFLTVQGGSGMTLLNVDDQADPFASTNYTVTRSSIGSLLANPILFSGLQGVTLNGESSSATYNVLSTGPGTPVLINGGAGNETFNVGSRASSLAPIQGPVTVNGGVGTDTLNLFDQGNTAGQAYTLTPTSLVRAGVGPINFGTLHAVVIDAGSGNDTLAVAGSAPTTPVIFNGGGGTNTVVGPAAANTWKLAGTNTGTLGGLTFISTQNLIGGSVSDTFLVAKTGQFAGTINGGTGVATLDYSQYPTGVVVNPATGTAPGAARVINIHTVIGSPFNDSLTGNLHADTILNGNGGIDKLQGGGNGRETYVLAATQKAGTVVTGGTGTDTLVGPNLNNTWSLTGANAGSVDGIATFSGIANLTGGALADTFQLHTKGSVTGTIDGGAGSNKVDYSGLTSAVTVNLQTKAATGTGGITNIQVLVGDGVTSTLVGTDVPNIWTFTGTNAGSVGGFTFSAIANLTGGASTDVFKLSTSGISKVLDGGGGVNTLDYSADKSNLLVDLPLGLAPLVGGGVRNIQNVIGGTGTSILVGNGTGNTLTGGSGPNILIAGPKPATLIGNTNQDILVGGTTKYDTNVTALNALMAEWSRRSVLYATRVNQLLKGGGLNGSTLLNGSTFSSNGGGNTLTGGANLDLFYGSHAKDTSDWNASQGEVFVESQALPSITINVGNLSTPSLLLDGNQVILSNGSALVGLGVGTHTLADSLNSAVSVQFTVAVGGAISYATSLQGDLVGAGTSTLTVHGLTVKVDATQLSLNKLNVDNAFTAATSAPFTFTGLPGTVLLTDALGGGFSASFTLNTNGTVGYAATVAGVLSGSGTTTLLVHDATVTINATDLSIPTLSLGNGVVVTNTAALAFTTLPGTYTLIDSQGSGAALQFSIGTDGNVGYASSLQGILTGTGTPTLTVHGATVTVNAMQLSLAKLTVDNAFTAATSAAFTFTGLPGPVLLTGPLGSGFGASFTLNTLGSIDYTTAVAGVLSGSGTTTLLVHDATVTIDATRLSMPTLSLGNGVVVTNTAALGFTALPGTYTLTDSQGAAIQFSIGADGNIGYASSLQGVLTGAGTPTLVVLGATVTVNATQLSLAQLNVDNAFTAATSAPFTFTGLPGAASLTDSASGFSASFTLNANGTVNYTTAVAGVLSGSGTTTLLVHDATVTIDATQLTLPTLSLGNGVVVTNTAALAFTALPGIYTLSDSQGAALQFSIGDDGNVNYSSFLQGILTGAGTPTLAVHGVTATIDATKLSLANLTVDNAFTAATSAPFTFTGLPGTVLLTDPLGSGFSAGFTLNANGTVGYAAAPAGVLSGRGTTTLLVHDATVTIDATQLSLPTLSLGNGVVVTNTAALAFTALPGTYTLSDSQGSGAALQFSIGADGNVGYASSLQGILTGAGTLTLVVHGVTVTIDATQLSLPQLNVDNAFTAATSASFTFTGLPGPASLTDTPGDHFSSGFSASFTLNSDGTVNYTGAVAGVLSGSGTTTLLVHDVTVTIDATRLSLPVVSLDYSVVLTNTAFAFTALPGTHTLSDSQGSGAALQLSLGADGTVGYDPSLEGVFSGAGTSKLTVNGATATIDATQLSLAQLKVDNAIFPNTSTPFTFTGLPGAVSLTDISAGASVSFTLAAGGKVDYDPSLNAVFSGRGTTTLVVNGVTVTVDATRLSLTSLAVDTDYIPDKSTPFTFTACPGQRS